MSNPQRYFVLIVSVLLFSPLVYAGDSSIELCHYKGNDRIQTELISVKLSGALHHFAMHDDGLLVNGQCLPKGCSNCLLTTSLLETELDYLEEQKFQEVSENYANGFSYCESIRPAFPEYEGPAQAWTEYEECKASAVTDQDELTADWDAYIAFYEERTNLIQPACGSPSAAATSCALSRMAEEQLCGEAYDAAVATAADALGGCYSPPKGDLTLVGAWAGSGNENEYCLIDHSNSLQTANSDTASCVAATTASYDTCMASPSACPTN